MNDRPYRLNRSRRQAARGIARIASLALVASMLASSSEAQIGSRLPRDAYYFAKSAFYAGELKTAFRGFKQATQSGLRFGDIRWVDSICYYAMLGDCYYHRGQLQLALEHYEQALGWYLANRNWLARIEFGTGRSAVTERERARIGWGRRATRFGYYPDTMKSAQGRINQRVTIEFGGVVNPAHYRSVDAVEVARCLALSLRRRAEILGPACRYSPLSAKLSNALSEDLLSSRHWANAWSDVLLGLALLGDGQISEGSTHLATGTTAGNFDHPLTGIALLELGKLAMRGGKYKDASVLLLQATLAAAQYGQADVVEEGFRYLTDSYLASGQSTGYPAIETAMLWARSEDFDRLHASLLLGAAEITLYDDVGDEGSRALTLLNQAYQRMGARDLVNSDLIGRFHYLMAMTHYRAGDSPAAAQSMKAALAYMQNGSLQLFHLATIERLHAAGRNAVSTRAMGRLFAEVLREPEEVDWLTQPLETMTMLVSPHTRAIEKWFELLIDRREYDQAISVAEQLRRHRFYGALPLGGRLLSLRWLVDGSSVMLGKTGMTQRTHLRRKYPQLARLSVESRKQLVRLQAMPTLPKDEVQLKTQREVLAKLTRLSEQQENVVREIALRREPSKLVFPPQPNLKAIQKAMKDDQAVLMFVTTQQGWHAWFIRRSEETYWSIKAPKAVRRDLAQLLRSIGNHDRNSAVQITEVTNDDWKSPARKLWDGVIGKFPSNGWNNLEELVIVPDGPLWYLPFELLQVPADQVAADEDQTLLDRVRIRYAPTARRCRSAIVVATCRI